MFQSPQKQIPLSRDFRSDTVTQPSDRMRKAMAEAVVGDDVIGEDPTVKALEEQCASLCGKEAGLFVPSGTMGNQIALRAHTKSGNEVIVGDNSHIVQHEAGAAALISRVQLRTVSPDHPHLQITDVKHCLRIAEDIHYPRTGLICLEQATAAGTVVSLDELSEFNQLGKQHGIPIHIDGARLFNAALYLNVSVDQITKHCNSATFCFSKGLGAPVGSMLVGSKELIHDARQIRKILGGGMRQVGVLAAPAEVALEQSLPRLIEDHRRAFRLNKKLLKAGVPVCHEPQINMVFVDVHSLDMSGEEFVNYFADNGFLVYPPEMNQFRVVIHQHHSDEDIDALAKVISKAFA